MLRLLLLVGTMLCLKSAEAACQAPRAVLFGRVVDATTKEPLEGVVVRLSVLKQVIETDKAGVFRLADLPSGLVEVQLARIGYALVKRNVTLTAGRTVNLEYTMLAETARLPDVHVAGRAELVEGPAILAGFEERRRMGGGVFLDQETLERSEGRAISDVLRGTTNLASSRMGSRCTLPPTVN